MEFNYQSDVHALKSRFESWKVIILPLNSLLEWEHKRDPFVIILMDTFIFGLLMYYNPSILTTVSMIGLVSLFFETIVPLISNYLFKTTEW